MSNDKLLELAIALKTIMYLKQSGHYNTVFEVVEALENGDEKAMKEIEKLIEESKAEIEKNKLKPL